ncbi:MAG: NADH-quinone oxidoreductase subunit N [FCB group bacterium]|jgi:NADH-quinone oxidoreductase subunit N
MGTELYLISPIILISFFAVSAIVVDALTSKGTKIGFFYSLLGLILVGISSAFTLLKAPAIILPPETGNLITKGMITFGGYSAIFDIIFSVAGILTILASRPYLVKEYKEYNEYYSMLLFSISGMMLIAHTNNLLILFIGIEIMSISFYVLAGFFRTSIRSIEAALKYFLLGAFATGFLLYGMALIYGATGSISLSTIFQTIQQVSNPPVYLSIGIGLLIIGLCFKVAAFPFHQWAPDVYQGSPTVITGFMSTAGKAAAMVGFIIIARTFMPIYSHSFEHGFNVNGLRIALAFISAGTMLYGNIVAVVQKNVKRMLAYSSIAHAGYLLMGIVAKSPLGFDGVAFYAVAYMFMQIGAFAIVSVVERKDSTNLELSDYSGLGKTHPALAGLMAIFMFSLAGIPPFAGFFGKYYLFVAAIEGGFTWLTIVAVISSMISVYFYIGLIVYMYFKEPDDKLYEYKPGTGWIPLVISAVCLLIFGILPSYLLNVIHKGFLVFF